MPLIPIIFIILFILIFLISTIKTIFTSIFNLINYREKEIATVIKIEERPGYRKKDPWVDVVTVSYNYKGIQYQFEERFGKLNYSILKEIGSEHTVFVNSKDPNKIIFSKSNEVFKLLMAIFRIVVPICTIGTVIMYFLYLNPEMGEVLIMYFLEEVWPSILEQIPFIK